MASTTRPQRDTPGESAERPTSERWRIFSSRDRLVLGIGAIGAVLVLSVLLWGSGMDFPADVGRTVGREIDDWVTWITRTGAPLFDWIRDIILRILVRIEDALLWLPWPSVLLGLGLLAWKVAGVRLAAFVVTAVLYMGFAGLWASTMETLTLVVVAVSLALLIAIPVGILSARNNVVDAIVRPFLDLAQTMPAYVYLVPAIFFFSLGNVPAVFATVLYAVPPSIRLTNLGIRQVSPEVVEAARSFGTTSRQLLFKVQIPMAIPTIMAGINQTVMMALAMVVVAALVGAGGLGEDVLRALGRQEPGNAALAGFAIVFLAIVIDRITQAAARQRQAMIQGERR